jgi:guanylate kinase
LQQLKERVNKLEQYGAILLLSGPSGCGKSSLLKNLFQNIEGYYFSISTTTRAPRAEERDGVDYFFSSKEEFEKDIKNGNFLEWAEVHGNYYGTSLKPIQKALDKGKLVIFDIDVQGFEQIIVKLREVTTTVFITTPNLKELQKRLTARQTDSVAVIAKRIKNAEKEIYYIDRYDYILINDDLDEASNQLLSIAQCARLKSSLIDIEKFIQIWKDS